MKINHHPLFNTAEAEKIYSEKDGIPVKYVCTSATYGTADFAADVFYRASPHPEFGNHYFGLYRNPYSNDATVMIVNADPIESFEFGMIEDDGKYYYSQHRHDYKEVGDKMIDGGRAYIRSSGQVDVFKIEDGKFVKGIND